MNANEQDDDLLELRRKKMKEMLERQKQLQFKKELEKNTQFMFEKKIQAVVSYLLAPDASDYLHKLKETRVEVYKRIVGQLFPAQVLASIDTLIALIQSGRIPRSIIRLVDVQQLEREILGIKSTISIKKRGEDKRVDLASFLKGDDE
ncbi:MAG: hypothetical protein ACTSVI_13775 [Promethearchaeota archaeon]